MATKCFSESLNPLPRSRHSLLLAKSANGRPECRNCQSLVTFSFPGAAFMLAGQTDVSNTMRCALSVAKLSHTRWCKGAGRHYDIDSKNYGVNSKDARPSAQKASPATFFPSRGVVILIFPSSIPLTFTRSLAISVLPLLIKESMR